MNQVHEGFGNKTRNSSKHISYYTYTTLFNIKNLKPNGNYIYHLL
jgi:hypothetical protein